MTINDREAVHKRRRLYIVGSRHILTDGETPKPVIIILCLKPTAWVNLDETRSRGFIQSFTNEAIRLGMVLRPIFIDQTLDSDISLAEYQALFSEIRSLGGRYRGTMIAGDTGSHDSLGELVRELSRFGRPVLEYTQRRRKLPPEKRFGCYGECHIRSRESSLTAIRYLSMHGHRRIGFPSRYREPWETEREGDLKAAASEIIPPTTVLSGDDVIRRLKGLSRVDRAGLLEKLSRSSVRHVADLVGFLSVTFGIFDASLEWPQGVAAGYLRLAMMFEGFPDTFQIGNGWSFDAFAQDYLPSKLNAGPLHDWDVLLPILLDSSVTAIVFPRDRAVIRFYRALRRIGIKPGEDLSFLSFDNEPAYSTFPISSVDKRAINLGYRALHKLAGDIPVACDLPNGDLLAHPEVADRGSVKVLARD